MCEKMWDEAIIPQDGRLRPLTNISAGPRLFALLHTCWHFIEILII